MNTHDPVNAARIEQMNLVVLTNKAQNKIKRIYGLKRKRHLLENPFCWVSLLVFRRLERATVVHHRCGRKKHLLDERTFLSTTKEGDLWIHANPEKAKLLGLFGCEV